MSRQDEQPETIGLPLDFDQYQRRTERTAIGFSTSDSEDVTRDEAIVFNALGVNGEAGEIAEKVKKYRREGDEDYFDDVRGEIGDCIWYMARLCDEIGVSFEAVAESNLRKLADRKQRGQITGEGDER